MIRYETRGSVGLATIDREERRNALNGELCDELRGHLEAAGVEGADGMRAFVVTGAGSTFCAGADLVTRFGSHGGDSFRPAFEALVDAITDAPFPVIAAMNGHALGAGMQLAVACDLRVVAPAARLGIPAGKLGVHISPGNVRRLVQLAGSPTRARSSSVAPRCRQNRSSPAGSPIALPMTRWARRSRGPTRSRRWRLSP